MNRHIIQLQLKIYFNKKHLASLPDDNEFDNNSVDPSESIKWRNAKKNSSTVTTMNEPQGEAAQK